MRKLFGYFLGLFGLTLYIFLAAGLIDAFLPKQVILQMIIYAVVGIGWILPAMWMIRWWYRPKNTENN
ncbi:MAG: DUF2842 domain-containing protein [Emcibacter sp.]|nr:DUF2842 domain-containing protein [Emcibacter sp.]